jgi:hypothetical protein
MAIAGRFRVVPLPSEIPGVEGKMEKQHLDFDYDRYGVDHNPEFKTSADATGYWFAAAVLFAFVAAGIIVYRAGGADEFRTATNDVPTTTQTSPIDPPPLLKAQ